MTSSPQHCEASLSVGNFAVNSGASYAAKSLRMAHYAANNIG